MLADSRHPRETGQTAQGHRLAGPAAPTKCPILGPIQQQRRQPLAVMLGIAELLLTPLGPANV